MGLASPGSNTPGVFPPHLGRAGPFRSFGPLRNWQAESRLPASWALQPQISDQSNFTNYLVEGFGWRPERTLIAYPPGCSAQPNHLLDSRQEILHHP